MSKKSLLAQRLADREREQQQRSQFDLEDEGIEKPQILSSTTSSAAALGGTTKRASLAQKRLRKRGPLSDDLSSGKYSAVARNELNDDDEEEEEEDQKGRKGATTTSRNLKTKKQQKYSKNKQDRRDGEDEYADFNEEDALRNVDSIFGMLDAPDDEEDEGDDPDTAEDKYLNRLGKTEEEFAANLEEKYRVDEKPKKVRRVDFASALTDFEQQHLKENDGDDDDDHQVGGGEQLVTSTSESDHSILQQISALRKRQKDELIQRQQQQQQHGGAETSSSSSSAAADSSSLASPQHQLRKAASLLGSSFSHLLQLRLKLQPVLTKSVQLPQYYSHSSFFSSSSSNNNNNNNEKLSQLQKDLKQEIHSMIVSSLELVGGGGNEKKNNKSISDSSSSSSELYAEFLKTEAPARKRIDACVEEIGKRVILGPNTPKAKSDRQADIPLLDQIHGVMSGLTRLYNRAQKNRAHVTIFGHPDHQQQQQQNQSGAARKLMIAQGDVDNEIFDDVDFARELIQRSAAYSHHGKLIEAASSSSSTSSVNVNNSDGTSMKAVNALLQVPKTEQESRVAFHRKTKGRSVNYDPRPKLVGFMVPANYSHSDQQRDALFSNIFS